MHQFSDEKVNKIKTAINKALDEGATPIAAFDADGTLWSHDAGETFLEYKIKNKLVELPEDPWAHYERLKKDVSNQAAYLWLAQILDGVPIGKVRDWSKDCTGPLEKLPTFTAQKKIIDFLHSKGVEVFVVTASIKWAVEPGAAFYGIDHDHVVGITTKIVEGNVTTEQDGPITYREGKVAGIEHATGGRRPFFSAGNSEGDLPLLEAASHLRLVMASAPKNELPEMFDIEQQMVGIAKEKGWFYHSFV